MLGGFKILTITHRSTNLKRIGDFVVQNTEEANVSSKLHTLKERFGMEELLYLSTCNRVMYFFYTKRPIHNKFILDFFHAINPNLQISDSKESILEMVNLYEDESAIQHLHEVAASINSLVIGEREILRQLREAYEQSKKMKLTGDNIRLAMRLTVEAAKEVYAKTRIGEKPISVVSLAIQQLLKTNLAKTARILMIGAGQTNTLVSKFLKKHEYKNVKVFNRSLSAAQSIATSFGTKANTLDALASYSEGFDCMIVCTGATSAIVDTNLYQQLLQKDTEQKVVIDLSIPYNVAEEVVEQFDINYIEIEGLRALANENMAFREREVLKVRELLTLRMDEFRSIYQQRIIERAMREVPKEIKAVTKKALNEIFKNELESLDDKAKQVVLEIVNYMEKRCISIPMQAAKRAAVSA